MSFKEIPRGKQTIVDSDEDQISINSSGQMEVVLSGKLCATNSTSTPLNADAVFTGTAEEITDYGYIFVSTYSNVASATDGLSVQQSTDGTNWDNTDDYTVPAATGKTYSFQPASRYFRVVYTNGGSDQTAFRLQTICKKTASLASSHRIQDNIVDEDDAELMKSVITGKNPQDTFVNFTATTAGNFKVSLEEANGNIQDSVCGVLTIINNAHHEVHEGNYYYLEGYTTLAEAAELRVKLVTPDTAKWSHFTWSISSSGILTTEFYEGASGGMASGSRAAIHASNRNSQCWTGSHTGAVDQATVLTDSSQSWTVDALIGLQVFNATDGSSGIITDNDATTVTVSALAGGTGNDWDTDDVYEINNSQLVIESGVDAATDDGVLISSAKWGANDRFSVSGGGQNREAEIMLQQNTIYLRKFISGTADNIVQFRAGWYEHENI